MKTKKFLIIAILAMSNWACESSNDGNSIDATGTIEATNVVLSSKTPGEVKEILVKEGQNVKRGDTLLIIDTEALALQLEQALATEEIAQAQLNLVQKGARKEDIAQAESILKQAEANFISAKNDFDRFQKLLDKKSISEKQFEDVKTRYDIATAQYSSAKENFEKVKKIFRSEEIEQAKGNLRKATAAVNLLKKNICDAYLIAPQNGTIVKKFVEVGESVAPMSSLIKIADLTNIELKIYVSEVELGKVKLGQKAEIFVDSFPEKIYNGIVTYISPEAEFTPKNVQTKDERTKLVFAVKIQVQNENYELKSGMPADAKIIL